MMEHVDLGLAFMTGLLGSGHCVGMCGSLVSAFFVRLGEAGRLAWPALAYHSARILVYVLAGCLAALLGVALISTGLIGKAQGILQIVAGVIVILLGLDLLGWSPLRFGAIKMPVDLFRSVFQQASQTGAVRGAALAGLLNGLMPCAMTMAMAVKATSADSVAQGGLLMFAFGLGTLPSMLFVSLILGRLSPKIRGLLLKAAAVFVIALGLMTLYQGVRFLDVMLKLPNW
ncbi:MAG: sulfite exporter TauE/SafE family protein [Rhodospirillales bacterium]|nr:sulfite exporter TauE/SafE family protein [Rhodospirillales bacterium]